MLRLFVPSWSRTAIEAPTPNDPANLFAIGVTDNGEHSFWSANRPRSLIPGALLSTKPVAPAGTPSTAHSPTSSRRCSAARHACRCLRMISSPRGRLSPPPPATASGDPEPSAPRPPRALDGNTVLSLGPRERLPGTGPRNAPPPRSSPRGSGRTAARRDGRSYPRGESARSPARQRHRQRRQPRPGRPSRFLHVNVPPDSTINALTRASLRILQRYVRPGEGLSIRFRRSPQRLLREGEKFGRSVEGVRAQADGRPGPSPWSSYGRGSLGYEWTSMITARPAVSSRSATAAVMAAAYGWK